MAKFFSGLNQLNQWIKSLNIGYYDEDLDYTVDLTNIYLEVKAYVER